MTIMQPREITEAECDDALSRGDPQELEVLAGMVGVFVSDFGLAERVCLLLAEHQNPYVRGNALLGLGQLAFRFRRLREEVARPLVEAGLQDPHDYVRTQAISAAAGIAAFLGWSFPPSRRGPVVVTPRVVTSDGLLDVSEDLWRLATRHQMPAINLGSLPKEAVPVAPEALRVISRDMAEKELMVPILLIKTTLTVAIASPATTAALDRIAETCAYEVLPVLADPESIREMIDRVYSPSLEGAPGEDSGEDR